VPERIVTEIDGHQVGLSHLDRVVYPEASIIKAEIINYYLQVAPYMLPHLLDRPLVFTRYPSGVNETGFYQKNAPSYLPAWIPTYQLEPTKKAILARDQATLAWLANHGCIEIHPWLSRIKSLSYPDFLVIDLDPSPVNSWAQVIKAAQEINYVLTGLKLTAWPKTSGGKGLHIYLPIKPENTYQQVRDLALQIAGLVIKSMPDVTTTQRMKVKRGERIYIDCLQIGEGKTLCAPYSLRPTAAATVSTPFQWTEIGDINPADFTIRQVGSRLIKLGDLFSPVLFAKQSLKPDMQALRVPIKG